MSSNNVISVTLLHFKRNSALGKAVTARLLRTWRSELRNTSSVKEFNFNYRGNTDSELSVQADFFCDKGDNCFMKLVG